MVLPIRMSFLQGFLFRQVQFVVTSHVHLVVPRKQCGSADLLISALLDVNDHCAATMQAVDIFYPVDNIRYIPWSTLNDIPWMISRGVHLWVYPVDNTTCTHGICPPDISDVHGI